MNHEQATRMLESRYAEVRDLAAWAIAAHDMLSDAQGELREIQEQEAARQLASSTYLLVVLHRDGFVEIYASEWQPAKIACLPDLGVGSEDEAEAYMLSKVPLPYRQLYERAGKPILTGNSKGCMDRNAYRLLNIEVETIKLLKGLEEIGTDADGDDTADATKAQAQSASVSSEDRTTAAAK